MLHAGVKALNKTHFSNPSHASVVGDGISFVTVFTIYNNSPDTIVNSRSSNLVNVGNASYSKSERSIAILNVFINYIQVSMPQSNIIVLTDPNQISQCTKTELLNNKDQPLNSGSIAVRSTRDGKKIQYLFFPLNISATYHQNFLRKVLEVYSSRYMNASRMLGDQLALAWVVKSHPSFDAKRFSKAQVFIKEIDGASVLFLPCATFNWTPPEVAGQFHGLPLDVKVVQFKGSRNRLLLEAWNFFGSSADISDMLCLILKNGRTKYDFWLSLSLSLVFPFS
ncbi:hypothetical protein DITRI_Ditri11bG0165700 [Diplodiscus trichospermus]